MTVEARPCPLCGMVEAQVLIGSDLQSSSGEIYKVVACAKCGLRYTHPLPTVEELCAFYGDDYYVQNKPRLLSTDLFRLLFQRSILWQHRKTLLGRSPGRILDLGCGNGDFLADLRRRDWEVYGVEFSETACDIARAKGVAVCQGDLASANFSDGFFDVVTLWHVLEHLSDPRTELAEIKRILHDDGLLVIEVPDSDSLTFRLCGRHWYFLDVPMHLQHFTSETLKQMLDGYGFVPIRSNSFHHWDFTCTFYSYMNYLGILRRLRIRAYSTGDYKRASLVSKVLFFVVGVPVALFSFLHWIIALALSGKSESMTITFRKAGQ